MQRNESNAKVFSSTMEAHWFLEEQLGTVEQWVKDRVNDGAYAPGYTLILSALHDVREITKRFIVQQEKRIVTLQERTRDLSESSLCPRCGNPRTTVTPKE